MVCLWNSSLGRLRQTSCLNCFKKTFVLTALVELFQREIEFLSNKHPCGYWNRNEIVIIVVIWKPGHFQVNTGVYSERPWASLNPRVRTSLFKMSIDFIC